MAQPELSYGRQYLHADLFEMASACLYHFVMNHPFVDGNKGGARSGHDLFGDQ